MCGRVDLHTPPAQLARFLAAQLAAGVDPEGRPSYNVPPTRALLAVTDAAAAPEGEGPDEGPSPTFAVGAGGLSRLLDNYRWGLLPHWAKDHRVGAKMINARAETIATKPAYRSAFANRRCLIVVDGFFEWKALDARHKQPFYFRRADGAPITLAGVYEHWWDKSRPKEDTFLKTCAIVTTSAGPDMEPVHDRMPAILESCDYSAWLNPEEHDVEALTRFLVPAPAGTLLRHPIDLAVNSPRNDGPQIIAPVEPASIEPNVSLSDSQKLRSPAKRPSSFTL